MNKENRLSISELTQTIMLTKNNEDKKYDK